MTKLTIHRRAYTRKSYRRKDGIVVKATHIPASIFKVKDRGETGRTPKSEQWYNPRTTMKWHKDQGVATRRHNALIAHNGDELATARALQALANVSTDETTKKLARADAGHFYNLYKRSRR